MNWVDWKAWRKQSGLTQLEVLEMMNLRGFKWTQPTLGKIENGERKATFSEGIRLCAIYDINIYQEMEKGN